MAKPASREKTPAVKPRGAAFVERVLDVTLRELAERGYERLSIPEVAELAGANKTSVYRRWPGKAELVRDAIGSAMGHASVPLDTGSLRGDLLALARATAEIVKSPAGTAVLRVLLAEQADPEVRVVASSAYQAIGEQGPFVVLKRAAARGEIAGSVDPSLILFTVAGAILHRTFIEQGRLTDAFLEQVVDLVLKGALARPERGAPSPREPSAPAPRRAAKPRKKAALS